MTTTIYILKLNKSKYYVGKTNRSVNERYREHLEGIGSLWTKKYKPLSIVKQIENSSPFDEDRYVKEYMAIYGIENVKNGVKNEKKVADNYKKAYKTYQKELKSALKEYHKTESGKLYKKKVEKLFKELSYNIKTIALSKCSFEKCLKLHKKGLLQVKTITAKLCKEKNKKSCKISDAIAKLDVKKFNYKDNKKISKMIKKGLT